MTEVETLPKLRHRYCHTKMKWSSLNLLRAVSPLSLARSTAAALAAGLCLAAVPGFTAKPQQAIDLNPKGLKLEAGEAFLIERNSRYGAESIYLNERGMRIIHPHLRLDIIARPPNWNLIWCSGKSQGYFEEPLRDFRMRRGMSATAGRPPNWPAINTSYAGLQAKMLLPPVTAREQATSLPFMSRVEGTRPQYIRRAEIYMTEAIKMPQGAVRILAAEHCLPQFDSIPLACHEILSDGTVVKPWSTKSVKVVKEPPGIFQIPSRYHACKSQDEAVNSGFVSDVDEMVKDLKIGEDFGSGKKHGK